ncbi:hypothetical protein Mucpa_1291 [Mucilaginibacter paludis DSM 18603]|uniref:Uncharacterized protein n=1 Tax=Mucilaginibacter paludis DSM 18603 TaxID=714943 RepID=H1YHC0_9SPHI|nr:hypothetical protein Mucpa_1291 [Mucilaginibacter paludis DSM 18603]
MQPAVCINFFTPNETPMHVKVNQLPFTSVSAPAFIVSKMLLFKLINLNQ